MLSVIIPTCNRPEQLSACLSRLGPGAQTLPFDRYEVIVSDDGRRMPAEEHLAKSFPWVRWVTGPALGPAANRNCGAKAALGQWLAFVDDDCLPEQTWLEAITENIAQGMDVVEGKTVCPDATDTPFQEQVQNLTGGVLWSCNLGIRRDIFEQIGGFDEDFREAGGEDMEFAWRVAHSGILQSFEPRALVVHPARNIGWKQIVRRLLMIRWMSLYHLKTKQSPPLEKPAPSVVLWVIGTRTLNLLRTSSKSLKRLRGSGGNRAFFDFALNLLSFPFLLPYIVLWELRFRRMLKERSSAPVEKPIPMPSGSRIA